MLDIQDEHSASDIERLGLKVLVTNTMMHSLEDRCQLADNVLSFCREIARVSTAASSQLSSFEM